MDKIIRFPEITNRSKEETIYKEYIMKRNKLYCLFAIVLSLALAFSACGGIAKTTETPADPSPAAVPADTSVISPSDTNPAATGVGMGNSRVELNYSFNDYIEGLPEADIKTDSAAIETLPVYKDRYSPILEFDVTDDLLAEVEENLYNYLKLAGLVGENEKPEFDTVGDALHVIGIFNCKWNGVRYYSGPNGISVGFISREIRESDSIEETMSLLKENALFNGACKYLGIENPSVDRKITYKPSGEEFQRIYTIYEPGDTYDETIYNRNYKCISLMWLKGTSEEKVSIIIRKIDTSEKLGDYPMVSYEDALTILSNAADRDVTAKDVLASEIIYNSMDTVPGYYIPCYRIYLDEGEAERSVPGMHSFAYYDIPAVDYGGTIK